MVDAGQKPPAPMSVFNDRECQFSVIAHNFEKQRTDPAYEREFQAARRRIARVVAAVNKLLDRTQRPDGQSG